MPFYKYVANRFLTLAQNLLARHKLSEYHTGFRAFSRAVLETLPLLENSDDFVFDNQMLAQAIGLRLPHRRGLLPHPLPGGCLLDQLLAAASSTAWGCCEPRSRYRLSRWGIGRPRFLAADGRRIAAIQGGTA